MEKQTIQIAITAIDKWTEQIKKEEGLHNSPQFFRDMKKARKQLSDLLNS